MSQTGRWLPIVAGSLVIFGLCVWLGDALLPWDQATRIGTGAGAGAVIASALGAWASSSIGSSASSPGPAAGGPTATGERSVAAGDNSGIIVTGDNGTVQR